MGQRCCPCPFHVQIFKADIEEMSASLSQKTRRTTLSRALGKKMTKKMRCQLCPRRGVEMIPLNIQQNTSIPMEMSDVGSEKLAAFNHNRHNHHIPPRMCRPEWPPWPPSFRTQMMCWQCCRWIVSKWFFHLLAFSFLILHCVALVLVADNATDQPDMWRSSSLRNVLNLWCFQLLLLSLSSSCIFVDKTCLFCSGTFSFS